MSFLLNFHELQPELKRNSERQMSPKNHGQNLPIFNQKVKNPGMAYNFSSAPQTEDAPKVESEEFTGRQPLFKADSSAVSNIYLRIQRKSSQRKEEERHPHRAKFLPLWTI